MTADKTDAWDARPGNREIVQTAPGKFEARDAADNLEPSMAILSMFHTEDFKTGYDPSPAIKAVRPLLIAEARPQIEAAERERVISFIAGLEGCSTSYILSRIREEFP